MQANYKETHNAIGSKTDIQNDYKSIRAVA